MRIKKITGILLLITLFVMPPVMAQNEAKDYREMRWKDVAVKMPDQWYASNEAKSVAENLLLAQKDIGG
jgi:pectinesterase